MNKYLDDLNVGDTFHTATALMTEQAIIDYAIQWDPQPIHTDREAAAAGMFKGIIASGWHTAAVAMRLTADAKILGDTPILGMGVKELQWSKPVRPGDTLRVEIRVDAITPSKSKPGFGIVSFTSRTFNQTGELVFLACPNCWAPLRPVGT
ncbi:MAG: MaoC family dehydratase [Acidobacteriota bacterium]